MDQVLRECFFEIIEELHRYFPTPGLIRKMSVEVVFSYSKIFSKTKVTGKIFILCEDISFLLSF